MFEQGRLPTRLVKIEGANSSRVAKSKSSAVGSSRLPPKPLLLGVPEEEGEYPVVLVFHGFLLRNHHYSQLLQHVASHGFIVIAPQMYNVCGADASQEIADAAAIVDWLPGRLTQLFPEPLSYVRPNFDKLALVGHSRGAKVAFGLALGLSKTSLNVCAIAGLDPVDGRDVGHLTTPPILRFSKHSFELQLPILIVGAGLGSQRRNALFPPCAPDGVNHRAFFFECSAPAFYFVAPEHGHMDFLDDRPQGFRGKLSHCPCKNGTARAPMRRFAGGLLVAFLQAAMFSDTASLQHLLENPSRSPVKLADPDWHIGSSSSRSEIPQLNTVFC